jgi:hypothetical protein
LETHLKVLGEILDFKFQIPSNIFASLLDLSLIILLTKIELTKDFLVNKILTVLDKLAEA